MKARMKLAIAAALALTLGLAAFAAFYILAEPSLSESELDAIARDWAADNMDGAARDELVEFMVANTSVNSKILFREYLNVYVDSDATTWSYGPFESAGRGSYEAYATVALRLSDIMPPPVVLDDTAPVAPGDYTGDFRNAFRLTFLLTVDTDSKSVTEWRVGDGKAVYVGFPPPSGFPLWGRGRE